MALNYDDFVVVDGKVGRYRYYSWTRKPEFVAYHGKGYREIYKYVTGEEFTPAPRKKKTSRVNARYVVKNKGIKKLFATDLNVNGRAKGWARSLAANGNSMRVQIGKDRAWYAKLGYRSKSGGIKGALTFQSWIKQLEIAAHQVTVQAENFRIAIGYRAQKVFQESWKLNRFNTAQSTKWQALSAYTLRKRAKRKTGSKILREYGDLFNSIKVNENTMVGRGGKAMMGTQVYTDIVPADASKHKKNSICYAGWHNEGEGTYGRGFHGRRPKHYVQRQFMGHSTAIDNFAAQFADRYLFDMVFLDRLPK